MKTCRYCAETDLQDAAAVCKHCGKDVLQVETPYYQRDISVGGFRFSVVPVLGSLLLLGGAIVIVFFFAFFNTSVEIPKQEILGQTIGGGNVNNLGLMADRQNGILMGIGAAVVGVILVLFGSSNRKP